MAARAEFPVPMEFWVRNGCRRPCLPRVRCPRDRPRGGLYLFCRVWAGVWICAAMARKRNTVCTNPCTLRLRQHHGRVTGARMVHTFLIHSSPRSHGPVLAAAPGPSAAAVQLPVPRDAALRAHAAPSSGSRLAPELHLLLLEVSPGGGKGRLLHWGGLRMLRRRCGVRRSGESPRRHQAG